MEPQHEADDGHGVDHFFVFLGIGLRRRSHDSAFLAAVGLMRLVVTRLRHKVGLPSNACRTSPLCQCSCIRARAYKTKRPPPHHCVTGTIQWSRSGGVCLSPWTREVPYSPINKRLMFQGLSVWGPEGRRPFPRAGWLQRRPQHARVVCLWDSRGSSRWLLVSLVALHALPLLSALQALLCACGLLLHSGPLEWVLMGW